MIHENRGLNPHIEDIARRLALENVMTFASDGLTSVGGYPGDDETGGKPFGKVDRATMGEGYRLVMAWPEYEAAALISVRPVVRCYRRRCQRSTLIG